MGTSGHYRCHPGRRRESVALEYPAARMHQSVRHRRAARGRRRGHNAHRQESTRLLHSARLPDLAVDRIQRGLAHQWLSDLVEPLDIQSEPQRIFLQRRSELLRFAHVLERLLLTLGQGLCRRHRSPPRSRHIAAGRHLARVRSRLERRGYWSTHLQFRAW